MSYQKPEKEFGEGPVSLPQILIPPSSKSPKFPVKAQMMNYNIGAGLRYHLMMIHLTYTQLILNCSLHPSKTI